MMNMIKLWQLMTCLSVVFTFIGCSDKSDFSEKYRGEDPFFVSEPTTQPQDGEDTLGDRFKTDQFQQAARTNLDVLWVIDNSASMAPYQEMLAVNIDSFLDSASSWDADIQMGITSTDMCEAIRPTDPAKVLCPDKAQTNPGLRGKLASAKTIRGLDESARLEFSRIARLGTSGSSFEHGLSAAKAAVELSLAGQNSGLVRENSFLSVVIVSDEQDDGVGLSRPDEAGKNWWAEGATRYKYTAENLLAYLRQVRPEGQFSVSSVVGLSRLNDSNGPCGSNGTLEVGSEQLRASQLSGGFTLDICSNDWAAGLQAMADNFAAQLSSFKLSSRPENPSTIMIKIDGAVLASGWRYVDARQSIVFDADHVPEFGALIQVTYK